MSGLPGHEWRLDGVRGVPGPAPGGARPHRGPYGGGSSGEWQRKKYATRLGIAALCLYNAVGDMFLALELSCPFRAVAVNGRMNPRLRAACSWWARWARRAACRRRPARPRRRSSTWSWARGWQVELGEGGGQGSRGEEGPQERQSRVCNGMCAVCETHLISCTAAPSHSLVELLRPHPASPGGELPALQACALYVLRRGVMCALAEAGQRKLLERLANTLDKRLATPAAVVTLEGGAASYFGWIRVYLIVGYGVRRRQCGRKRGTR